MTEFLDLAARGKTAWWRYPVTFVLTLILWIAMCVLVFLALRFTHLAPADLSVGLTTPTHVQEFYGGTGVLFGLYVLALMIALRLIHAKHFRDVLGVWNWRLLARGTAVWFVVCAAAALIDYLIRPAGFRETASVATIMLAVWAVPGLAIQTFAEEFMFRGYVTQGLLLATRRPAVAAVVSGLLFGLLHIPNGWPQAASAAAFGVVTAFIAIRTSGIAFTYGLHLVNNVFGAVIVVSANDVFRGSPALFTENSPNLLWLDAAITLVALLALPWFFGARSMAAFAKISRRPS